MTSASIQQILLSLKSSTAEGTLYSATLSSDSDGWDGFTGVERIQASAMTLPGGTITKIRVRCKASTAEAFTVTNMYVGHRASSGDPYDFSATPTQILFGGSASKVVAAGTTELSDWITFSYNKTNDLLISFYCAGGGSSDAPSYATGLTGTADYEKTANDAATVNKSGYSANSGDLVLIDKIESDGF